MTQSSKYSAREVLFSVTSINSKQSCVSEFVLFLFIICQIDSSRMSNMFMRLGGAYKRLGS